MSLFDKDLLCGTLNQVVQIHEVGPLDFYKLTLDNKELGVITQGGFLPLKKVFNSYCSLYSTVNDALDVDFDTTFRPYRKPDPMWDPYDRIIDDYKWWDMVKSSFEKGLESQINPEFEYALNIRTISDIYVFAYSRKYKITITLFRHKDYGVLYKPVDDDELCQLYKIQHLYAGQMDPETPVFSTGVPVEIEFTVDLEYHPKDTKDNRDN